VPSRLRLRLTGVAGTTPGVLSVRIGSVTIASTTGAVEVEPGIYTIDFDLPATLNMAGDRPVVVTVNVNGTLVTSRLDDTAPRVFIL
jgi:prophage tail gpP-like protein